MWYTYELPQSYANTHEVTNMIFIEYLERNTNKYDILRIGGQGSTPDLTGEACKFWGLIPPKI